MAHSPPPAFAAKLIRWQKKYGRHNLPWQNTREPYHIWLAETMLQQTQTTVVALYYKIFLQRFPDIATLSRAREDSVLALWRGLGYYARARHLHQAAKIIKREHGGIFPRKFKDIEQLPGIGLSTAAAISVFVFGRRLAILDGNVKRVLARYYAVSADIGESKTITHLWQLAKANVPKRADIRAYTQGVMDLGATICIRRNPRCSECPLSSACTAYKDGIAENLPVRRYRARPHKRLLMTRILNKAGDKILLHKRPDTGIWGRLWSLPEFTLGESAKTVKSRNSLRDAAQSLLGISLSLCPPKTDAVLHCEFTHYSLSAEVASLRATETEAPVSGAFRWLAIKKLPSTALAEPVYRFLRRQLAESF